MVLLKYLPALVQRSSCPLARITFELIETVRSESDWELFDGFQPSLPLAGVTDLVFENVEKAHQTVTIKKLLLEEYFPDLLRLTLRLDPFLFLLDEDVIRLLLDRKPPRHGAANGGRLRKILVKCGSDGFNYMLEGIGERLKAMQSSFSLRDDGFEILIPEA
jgi:hypothetical protein